MLRAFVLLALVSACTRDPGASSAPRVRSRTELPASLPPLPKRALYHGMGGIAAHDWIVVDTGARTLEARIEHHMRAQEIEDPRKPVSKQLSAADVDRLWQLAEAAWPAPHPASEPVTDYAETVVAVDGDRAMLVQMHSPMKPDEPAAKLARALRLAAGWPY